jgi:cytochrome c-type biogenesis protein CcmH/NrfF
MCKMKSYRTVLLILICFSLLTWVADAQEQEITTDPSLESNLEELTTSVYCYCGCVRETIRNCVCGTAQQVEMDFRNRLSAGGTVQQILADYLAKYGTQFSALMPAKGFNIVAYAMPAVIIVLVGVIVFLVLRSKRKAALAKSPVTKEPQQPRSTDQYEQIEEELERYKQQR